MSCRYIDPVDYSSQGTERHAVQLLTLTHQPSRARRQTLRNPARLPAGNSLRLHQASKHTDQNSIINTAPKLVTSTSITFYLLAADLLRS